MKKLGGEVVRQRPKSKRILEALDAMRPDGLTTRQVAEQFCGGGDIGARKRAHSLLHALKLRNAVDRRAVDGSDPIYVIAGALPVKEPPAPRPPRIKPPRPPPPPIPAEETWSPDASVVEAMEKSAEVERERWFRSWKTVEFVCCEPKEPISELVSVMAGFHRPALAWVIARKSGMVEHIAMRYLKRLCAEGLCWRSYGQEDELRFELSDRCRLMLGERPIFSGDMR